MKMEPVFIGMDLGTFKTSVACSNGMRDVLHSAVGWPKDHVARMMLGRDVVFGNEVVEQRLALNVIRPFEKGALKYHQATEAKNHDIERHKLAAKLLIEHAVARTRPPKDRPVYGIIGTPAQASVAARKIVLEAAKEAFTAVMVVSEPFLIAYGMNRLHDTLVIDIGAGTIDLCPVYGAFPREDEQVTLPLGGDMIDEQFYNALIKARPDVRLSLNMAREIKEKYGYVHELKDNIVVTLPVQGVPTQIDVTEPLKTACKSIVAPILKALREMIARFDPEFQQRMLDNIVLGGGGSQLRGLSRLLEESLAECGGGKVKLANDPVYAGAVGALKLAMGMPAQHWEPLQTRAPVEKVRAAA